MGRLIDADALDYSLGASDEDIYFHHMWEDAPTIDAIPVEWLKARIAPYTGDVSDIGKGAHNATIKNLIRKWQNEQGDR